MSVRIATWNINSLRLRLGLLEGLVAALRPDVLCLQETKVPDELFPADGPAALGFPHVARRGMKGYNGVAILSRIKLVRDDDTPDWCLRGDCRHLGVTLGRPRRPARFLRARRRRRAGPRGQRQIRPQTGFRGRGDGVVRRPAAAPRHPGR
jgi:hypothetical protein